MHIDPSFPTIIGALVVIFGTGLVIRMAKQPYPVAYIIAGVLLGSFGFGVVEDPKLVEKLGSYGVVLLLFFIGMEFSIPKLVSNWKIAVFGTFLQILISVTLIWILGQFFDWSLNRTILIGFVISLSSTAMVLQILSDKNEMDSTIGTDALSILIAQDVAIVPMLIIVSAMGSSTFHFKTLTLQLCGVAFLGGTLYASIKFSEHSKKIITWFTRDKELQIFSALLLSLILAYISGWLELSSALGAFVGGIIISNIKFVEVFHKSLDSFRVIFVALFFASVGLQMDLNFLFDHWLTVVLLVLIAFVTNTMLNAFILRFLGRSWEHSFRAGAYLSQIGEFSFVLVSLGYAAQAISEFAFKSTLLVIALTMLLTPFWIFLVNCIWGQTIKIGIKVNRRTRGNGK